MIFKKVKYKEFEKRVISEIEFARRADKSWKEHLTVGYIAERVFSNVTGLKELFDNIHNGDKYDEIIRKALESAKKRYP